MRTGGRGLALIKDFEGLRLTAYRPIPSDPWTIGYGHTSGVTEGMVCTAGEAEAWLREDLEHAERVVLAIPAELTPAMVDALVSLVFNCGPAPVSGRNTIGRALRARDYFTAWSGFTLWKMAGGRRLLGLARRRTREMELFLEDGFP